ncbi:hypothetical protein LWM68_35740 [Niabella sp. W65]|nr:hypothetical protein [Niabella sp. W65]MCH7367641.1 hypothetical protein [Niabella sp. W65]
MLKEFRSVKNIREKTLDELTAIVGAAKAKVVWEHFNSGLELDGR